MLTVLSLIAALGGVLCTLPQENLYVIISLCKNAKFELERSLLWTFQDAICF